MRCERCGSDCTAARYDIDGFSGYLCDDCRAVWEELLEDAS